MSYHPNAERRRRAEAIIEARKGNGSPELVASLQARDAIVAVIAQHARKRRYAIKLQQKIDRQLESYIRINHTEWVPDASEAERKKINAHVSELIDEARVLIRKIEKADPAAIDALIDDGGFDRDLLEIVGVTDHTRGPADDQRRQAETKIYELCAELPVAAWVNLIKGAGIPGLALIVAEAGSLDNYPNPQKLWKRLGYAPYDGHAGSTWKRETWRKRKLTADEWVANPFSGERYAAMYNVAESMVIKHQWISAKKNGGEEGRPNGRYGEIYYARRKHTEQTHPDWTKGHRKADAVRVAMKQFLVDLWEEWVDRSFDLGHSPIDTQPKDAETAAAGHVSRDAHVVSARGGTNSKKWNGQGHGDAHSRVAVPAAAGHTPCDAQGRVARGGTKSKRNGQTQRDAPAGAAVPVAAGHCRDDAQLTTARGGTKLKKRNGQLGPDIQEVDAVPAAAGQVVADAQIHRARGGTPSKAEK